jgi:hypothetical protein
MWVVNSHRSILILQLLHNDDRGRRYISFKKPIVFVMLNLKEMCDSLFFRAAIQVNEIIHCRKSEYELKWRVFEILFWILRPFWNDFDFTFLHICQQILNIFSRMQEVAEVITSLNWAQSFKTKHKFYSFPFSAVTVIPYLRNFNE